MKYKILSSTAALAMVAAAAVAQDRPANHLILTEVVINSIAESATGSSEYVEIFNPTDSAIALDNYYVTDWAQFYNFPIFIGSSVIPDVGGGDYIMRFPAGSSIPSGGTVVVCWHANSFATDFFAGNLANYFSQPGSPQLFETNDSNPLVPNMISYNSNADANASVNFSKTNVGEFVELAYYDGVSDLVKDVDIVSWGSTNASGGDTVPQRAGISSDGPDPDGTSSDYQYDGGIDGRNFDVDPNFDPNSLVRRTTMEIGERNSVGNGHQGQDETLEWCFDTWIGNEGDGGSATDEDNFLSPGIAHLVKNSASPGPWIGATSRSVEHPTPGSTFDITCRVGAVGTPTVTLFLESGSGTTQSLAMTLDAATQTYKRTVGPFAAGTRLRYYFQAVDGGKTARYPVVDGIWKLPYESDHFTCYVRTTPVTQSDLIFNEIQANPSGTDNGTYSEWVEVYNKLSTPVDMGGFHYSDFNTDTERCLVPDGAIVPANGYLILTSGKTQFLNLYPWISPSSVFEMHDKRTNAVPGHNNDTDSIVMSDANSFRWLCCELVPLVE